MDTYFSKFPIFTYNGLACRNISRRSVISTVGIPGFLFYPHTIQAGMRADSLSYYHFDDPYQDWLIYLLNGIVDPYYGWYLSEVDFENFIKAKYGSLEEANRRVKYYQANWFDDPFEVSVSYYNETLPEQRKKYYTPTYGRKADVIGYKRREEDWFADTNRIDQINITLTSNTAFTNGELIDFKNSGEVVGGAEIITANSTVIVMQHISGNVTSNTNYIVSLNTDAEANVSEHVTLSQVIPADEFAYWGPISFYEWENQRNEDRKHILLVEPSRAIALSEQLRKSLK